ncbi:hypothetical protein SRHO_G00275990 [Serrasalmus rhombeus]
MQLKFFSTVRVTVVALPAQGGKPCPRSLGRGCVSGPECSMSPPGSSGAHFLEQRGDGLRALRERSLADAPGHGFDQALLYLSLGERAAKIKGCKHVCSGRLLLACPVRRRGCTVVYQSIFSTSGSRGGRGALSICCLHRIRGLSLCNCRPCCLCSRRIWAGIDPSEAGARREPDSESGV